MIFVIPNTYDTKRLLRQFQCCYLDAFNSGFYGFFLHQDCYGFTDRLDCSAMRCLPAKTQHNVLAISPNGQPYEANEVIDGEYQRTYWVPVVNTPVTYHPPATVSRLPTPAKSTAKDEPLMSLIHMPVLLTGASRYTLDGNTFVSLQILNADPVDTDSRGLQPARMTADAALFDQLPLETEAYPYACVLLVQSDLSSPNACHRAVGLVSKGEPVGSSTSEATRAVGWPDW